MTKQTNAELIADVRSIDSEWVLDNSPDDSVETIRELAARLEAADQRAAELAAVIEQTEDFVTRHYLDMEMGRSLIEVLAIEPGGALREHDAALIGDAYGDAEQAAVDALETWWLSETLPEDDTSSVDDVKRAIRAARQRRKEQS